MNDRLQSLVSDELDHVAGALHVIGGPVPVIPPAHPGPSLPPWPLPPDINPGGPIQGKQPA